MHAKIGLLQNSLYRLKNISLCRKIIIAYQKWLVKWLFTRIGYFELRICELYRKYIWFLNPCCIRFVYYSYQKYKIFWIESPRDRPCTRANIIKSYECRIIRWTSYGRPHGGARTEDIYIKDKVYAIIVGGGVLDAPWKIHQILRLSA